MQRALTKLLLPKMNLNHILIAVAIYRCWLSPRGGCLQFYRSYISFYAKYYFLPNVQVWHINGKNKILLPPSDQSKFYSGDCYIFQYAYPGEEKEEYLIGTWFGKMSVEVNFQSF